MKVFGDPSGTIADKAFADYFNAFKMPFFVVLGVGLLVWVLLLLVPSIGVLAGFLSIIISFLAWFYCGWNAVKTKGFTFMQAAMTGGVGSLLASIVAGLTAVLVLLFFPTQFSSSSTTGFAGVYGGMSTETSMISSLIGFVVGMFISFFFGALVSGLGGFAASHKQSVAAAV